MDITAELGYAYVLVPNSVTEVKWFDRNAGAYSTMKFDVVDTSIPGHLIYKSQRPFGSSLARLDFTYGEVDNNYYYWYGIQDGTVANPSSPINASNYTSLAESSSELKESLSIDPQKGYAYVLVPNTVTEVKWFDLNLGLYSTMTFNVIDTSIPGHLVYMSERPFSGGNARLDFTYGEVDNNYYYYYGIQEGTLANPSSPINASNYTSLAESSSELKESMTIKMQKGYAYVLVPNTVTEIKCIDLTLNAYSTMKFNVIDTSIPRHLVYRSERPFSSGNARLDFTYGEYIVVTGITLDRTNVELAEGETTTLVATVAPDDATVKMVAWSTSDETIATVADGVVTAVEDGTATITAKAGDKKATCTVTVKERMTSIVITDPYTENNFTQDEDKENVSITYTRTLNNTEWNALYLPFEIPVSQLTDKYEVAYINAIHSYDEDDNGEIDRMSMEVIKLREGTLHANHPYLIKARTTAAKQMSITVENTTLYKAESRTLDCSSVYTKFEITGIYEKMTSAQLAGCYALSGGSWKNLASGSSLNPFRLYLRVSSREGSPVKLSEAALARIGIHVQGEETATSVEERLMQKQHKTDAVYDLSGRRVTLPKKGQTYIVNGKKRMY